MKSKHNTVTSRVYEYISNHPGCTRKEILTAVFPPRTRPGNVGIFLYNLQKGYAIENRGGNTNSARWYPTEPSSDENYLRIATELIDELEVVHPAIRKVFLARRLQEIYEDLQGES